MSPPTPEKPVPVRLWRSVRLAPRLGTCKASGLEADAPLPCLPCVSEKNLAHMGHGGGCLDSCAGKN